MSSLDDPRAKALESNNQSTQAPASDYLSIPVPAAKSALSHQTAPKTNCPTQSQQGLGKQNRISLDKISQEQITLNQQQSQVAIQNQQLALAYDYQNQLQETLIALGLKTNQKAQTLFTKHTPNTISRIFSKTKCSNAVDQNVSDGIQLPESFLAPITDGKLLAAILNIHEAFSGIPIQARTPHKYFSVDQNRLGRDKVVNDNEDGAYSIFNPTGRDRSTHLCHVHQFVHRKEQLDDDTVVIPEWILKQIGLKVGEPICITLDLRIVLDQERLLSLALKSITVMPMQKDWKNFGKKPITQRQIAGGVAVQGGSGKPKQAQESNNLRLQRNERLKVDKKDQAQESQSEQTRNEQRELIKKLLLEKIKSYRVIELEQILKFEKDGNHYEFQVIHLETYREFQTANLQAKSQTQMSLPSQPDPDQCYLNLPKLLKHVELSLTLNQQQITSRFNNKSRRKNNVTAYSMNSASSHLSANMGRSSRPRQAKDAKNESLDLEQVFKERGLDIFYMQELIDEHKQQQNGGVPDGTVGGMSSAAQGRIMTDATAQDGYLKQDKKLMMLDNRKLNNRSRTDGVKELHSQRVESAVGRVNDSDSKGTKNSKTHQKQKTQDMDGFNYGEQMREQLPAKAPRVKKRISIEPTIDKHKQLANDASDFQQNNFNNSYIGGNQQNEGGLNPIDEMARSRQYLLPDSTISIDKTDETIARKIKMQQQIETIYTTPEETIKDPEAIKYKAHRPFNYDYQQGVKERLEWLVKTGDIGKLNDQIIKANNYRTPQITKFMNPKDQKVLKPPQRAKVAFLVEMTEKKVDGEKPNTVDLKGGEIQSKRGYKEHESAILENGKRSLAAKVQQQIALQHGQDGVATQLQDTGNLDQIEESITSSIELRANPLGGGKIFSEDAKKEPLIEQSRAAQVMRMEHSFKEIPKNQNGKNSKVKPYLRKTAPTNIVVSKYNTATGGVSTYRQSNSRVVSMRKDTQRTVELAPGSLGQGVDSLNLALEQSDPVIPQGRGGKNEDPALGGERSGEDALHLVKRKEPNVIIKDCLAAGAESSPSSNIAKPVDQSICIPGNPSLNPALASRTNHSRGIIQIQGRQIAVSKAMPQSASTSSYVDMSQKQQQQSKFLRQRNENQRTLSQDDNYDQQAAVATDPGASEPSQKKRTQKSEVMLTNPNSQDNHDLLSTSPVQNERTKKYREVSDPQDTTERQQMRFGSSLQNSLTTVLGAGVENPIKVINTLTFENAPSAVIGHAAPGMSPKNATEYLNRPQYASFGSPNTRHHNTFGSNRASPQYAEMGMMPTSEYFQYFRENYLSERSNTVFGLRCPRTSQFKLVSKVQSQSASRRATKHLSKSNDNSVERTKQPVLYSAVSHMRTQHGRDVPIYDRTASKLRSNLFWGLERQANTVEGGKIGDDDKPDRSRSFDEKSDSILKIVGVQSIPMAASDMFEGVEASKVNLDEIALGRILQMYSKIKQLHASGLIPSETIHFFQIEFINLIMSSQSPKKMETKKDEHGQKLWIEYLGRLEQLFQYQVGAAATDYSSPDVNKYKRSVGHGNIQVQAEIQAGSHEAEIVSRGDDLESLRSLKGLVALDRITQDYGTQLPIWPGIEPTQQDLSTGPVMVQSSEPGADHTSFTSGEKREASYRLRPVENHADETDIIMVLSQANHNEGDNDSKPTSPAPNSSKNGSNDEPSFLPLKKNNTVESKTSIEAGMTQDEVVEGASPTVNIPELQMEGLTVESGQVLPRELRSNRSEIRTSGAYYLDGCDKKLKQDNTPETAVLRRTHNDNQEDDIEGQLLADDDEDTAELKGQVLQGSSESRNIAIFKKQSKSRPDRSNTILVDDQIHIINSMPSNRATKQQPSRQGSQEEYKQCADSSSKFLTTAMQRRESVPLRHERLEAMSFEPRQVEILSQTNSRQQQTLEQGPPQGKNLGKMLQLDLYFDNNPTIYKNGAAMVQLIMNPSKSRDYYVSGGDKRKTGFHARSAHRVELKRKQQSRNAQSPQSKSNKKERESKEIKQQGADLLEIEDHRRAIRGQARLSGFGFNRQGRTGSIGAYRVLSATHRSATKRANSHNFTTMQAYPIAKTQNQSPKNGDHFLNEYSLSSNTALSKLVLKFGNRRASHKNQVLPKSCKDLLLQRLKHLLKQPISGLENRRSSPFGKSSKYEKLIQSTAEKN